MSKKIKLGLWGSSGHQIHDSVKSIDAVELIAFGAFTPELEEKLSENYPTAKQCETYEEFLRIPGLEMVSLCSPMRCEQAEHAIMALNAGISVYAEKPCALTEEELDRVIAAASKSRAVFHEMAGTIFEQPYWAMKEQVQTGLIGEVIQVFAQKSYPMYPGRPKSEKIDGGQILQNGVHAMRFIEHITGLQAKDIRAVETGVGEERPDSDLKMAASVMGKLENGGIFTAIMNYLNQPGLGRWGNEVVKVFGTKGLIESIDGGQRVRVILGEDKPYSLDVSEEAPYWLDLVLKDVAGENRFPFDLETELHLTRMVIRAKNNL